ncbi:MAG TPA: hypothetical protein VEJ63_11885 [Planctomycetota bacterium]|nr:hypothetical protein [Planctomycetota bacterium]
MSKDHSEAAPVIPPSEVSQPRERTLPLGLYVAFLVAIVAGITYYAGRESWLASKLFSDINDASASVVKQFVRESADRVVEKDINDGFDDRFGIVQFRTNADSVAKLLSQCEENPALAAKVFRRCMDEGSKSARLIAMYSAFFLIPKNQLDRADIDRVLSRIDPAKEKDADIRKAAQRMLSEFILLKDASAQLKYEALPANIGKSEGEWPSPSIKTLQEERKGTKQLRIRWSNPDTALAWWKEHGEKGSWSPKDHAWVVP